MEQELLNRYLEGVASPEEKVQVMRWVEQDEKNKSELLAMHRLYDVTVWQRTGEQGGRWPEKSVRRIGPVAAAIAGMAASLLLFLGVGWRYVRSTNRQASGSAVQTLHVPPGQRAELTLADGTGVWLNAGSTLTFPAHFPASAREVCLDGEGYFSVTKNERKPFIVKTSAYRIRVLGTEFNVRAYAGSPLFGVSLLKGAVEVYADSTAQQVSLEPGTRVYVENDRLKKDSIRHYEHLLWKEGIIGFDDEPVERMIELLELYFDTEIRVENESFKQKKYTGKFRAKDGIEHILNVLQLNTRFVYEKDEERNVITIR